jgi:phage gpG-like protein
MVGTFASQGARIGQNWKPLSPAYAKWKAVKYPGQPILRASDRMFGSLLGANGEAVEDVQRQSLAYGTRTPYAKYHQRGTPRMAQRRFLAMTEADRREIKNLIRLHLNNQARLGGFV